jgi:type IV pilus assembly protein PilO
MPDLRTTRKNLKTALAVMVAVDLVAAIVYFSPLVGSADSRRQELNRLQSELNTKTRQVAPLQNLPEKVLVANRQIIDFYKKRFPAQNYESVAEFERVAASDGVVIEQAKYKDKEEKEKGELVGWLQPIEIEADLSGSYTSLARFINALEQDQMFFIINSVTLVGEQKGPVKLNMKLEAYLKAGSR